ncbi:reverse transcriptase domain-containing protein [Tanacetum coccineum]
MSIPSLRPLIMEYLVKISKKARILELKRRHLKITVLTSYTPYPSRKIRRICTCTSQKTTKEQDPIRRIQRRSIRRIQVAFDLLRDALSAIFGLSELKTKRAELHSIIAAIQELRWLYLSISKQFHKFLYVHLDYEAIIAKFLGTPDSILYYYGLSTMFSAQQHGVPMKYLIMVLKLMQVTGCKLRFVIEIVEKYYGSMIEIHTFNQKLNKKKNLVKKLAKNHQAFLASESVIKQIPPLVGPGLNKTGNFPTFVSHQVSLEAKVNETNATVKFLL